MKFTVDTRSAYPIDAQIRAQVKLGLFFGDLRPGDTLPSIRELARELNVGAGFVRSAYGGLVRAGVLSASRSKRIVVNRDLNYRRDGNLQGQTNRLAVKLYDQALHLGIHPQSFAHFFQHWLRECKSCENYALFTECNRAQATQFAEEASSAWSIPVRGITFDELRRMNAGDLRDNRYLLTISYHYDEAREIASRHCKAVVLIAVKWDPDMLDRISRQPEGSHIVFVFAAADREQYGELMVRHLQDQLPGPRLQFDSVAFEDIKNFRRWVEKSGAKLLFFSNRLWDSLPESLKSRPDVATPRLITDPISLEKARTEIGLLS